MRNRHWFGLTLAMALAGPALAEPIQTLDLKPLVGKSPLDKIDAAWLLPRGLQVIDGVPFQIDGAVMLRDGGGSASNRRDQTNRFTIPIGRSFDCLHLLATAPSKADDGTVLGKFELHYADGTSAPLRVLYGAQVRHWFGPWHKTDTLLTDSNAREAWRAFCSEAAASDGYLRFFHVILTNPSPAKEVRTLVMDPKRNQSALMVAAMSIGPRTNPVSQADTIKLPKNPLPDLRPRAGELARGEGVVRNEKGEAIAGARVRITGVRKFADDKSESPVDESAVNTEAVTGNDGRFALPSLPDHRLYKLMVFAEKFEPVRYGGLDPKSDPIEVRLKPAGPVGKFAVRGQVVGPGGKPVVGATVAPEGVSTGQSTSWGGTQGFPEQVLTGLNGEFVVSRKQEFSRVQLNVKATGLAPMKLWLPATNGIQTIEMGVGVIVQGRIMKDGKPLVDVRVGVSGSERSSEVFAGHFEAKTDTNGVFAFQHLPPDTAWNLYGIIASLKSFGAFAPQPIKTSDHGETNDVGGLEVKPGLRLAGRIKTANGEALPQGLKLRVGNDRAWDSLVVAVKQAGEFECDGLYPGQWNVSIDQQNWHLSGVNRSMDMWNGWQLTGLLEQDKDDLLLIIEQGKYEYYSSGSSGNGQLPSPDWPQNRPLSGAEPGGPLPIVLGGSVLDDKTGEPVKRYKVVPGYQPPVTVRPAPGKPILKRILEPFSPKVVPWNERPFWKFSQSTWHTNTNFTVDFVPLSSSPMLRIEAPGYQPYETTPTNATTTNLVIRLERGAGPNGVVLQPDGKPAADAVVIFGTSQEQFGLSGGKLMDYGHREAQKVAGKDGKFSFPARANGMTIFAAHPAGWTEESVARGGENLKLRLQPWAVLVGTLVDAKGVPMPGVDLNFTIPSDWQRGEPHINVNGQTKTDASGRFQFINVPPRRVEVARIVPVGPTPSRGWTYKPQTWVLARPGTNDLGKVTYDTPPPPPMIEQIRQRIGL